MNRHLVNIPKTARKGEDFEVKVLLAHVMETGHRRDDAGAPIPRHIIERFICTYLGAEVFRADLFPAIAANPYLAFFVTAETSGPVTLSWTDDRGTTVAETLDIVVE
ncbi:MAG: thiosulfate oxidation carrier complex protein SoxZ [Alphaproteobacteria bacterium]|nr:thiosulfate oxidation carrier complex protein SoxZ [Alphaproteobacteria bacterium]